MSDTMILGEVRGQMRELVHTINNLSMKFDTLSREVIGLGPLATDIAEMKTKLVAAELRVTALEADRNRRDGATGLVGVLLKSPALGWLVGAAVTAWAILTGKVHI